MSNEPSVVVIDYGIGNVGSIINMLKKIGVHSVVSGDARMIEVARKLILPGVGAFDKGMSQLHNSGLVPLLHHKVVEQKTPVLGICLGMQLMTIGSEEGQMPGLGWIDATTIRFDFSATAARPKVPHMGWNELAVKTDHSMFRGMETSPRFYFVHSYHVICKQEQDVIATTTHGYSFVSVFARGCLTGVQFHPEKSHKYGMMLLQNWARS